MHDLAVIGAGPAGSYLASLCAERMNVIVLEKKKTAGGKPCSGLVSTRIGELLPAKMLRKPGLIENKVKGAVIHIAGKAMELSKEKTAAYVIDRDVLDYEMAAHAKASGADVRFGREAREVSVTKDSVSVSTGKEVIESAMAAGCGGVGCVAAKALGARPPELLNGLIARVGREDRSDQVELWLDRKAAKGGFLWRIPRGDTTEFGGMGKSLDFKTLERFFRLKGSDIRERSAAPIPMGIVRTYGDRLILAGDSACQTKPWSGGGVVYSMLAAREGADVIGRCAKKGDFGGDRLKEYEERWHAVLMKDIMGGMMLREVLYDVPESELSMLASRLAEMEGLGKGIDFDLPFSGAMKFLGDFLGG